jgi:signal transduction histidine kinase
MTTASTASSRSATAQQRSVTRHLTRRYILALGTIVLLTILGQLIVQIALAQQSSDARVINMAALQRTLSERMSKAALAILVKQDTNSQTVYVNELQTVLAQWESSHLALQHGDTTLGLPGHNSAVVTRLFAQIAPNFNLMLDAATDLLVVYESAPPVPMSTGPSLTSSLKPYVDTILTEEPGFRAGMDTIVSQYQLEAEQRVSRLQAIEWSLLAVTLVVVIVLGIVVFRPVTRYVGQSIEDLVAAREREHELAALKDQFIIDVNHELRTPMMALYNNLEVLSALAERGVPEQRARILERALTSGDALLRLLTNVLDTSTLEGKDPRLDLKAITLAPLVRGVLETFDPREIGEPGLQPGEYEARAVTVQIAPELAVWADEGRLRQILINLLANALKYSAPGTPIDVSASRVIPDALAGRRGTQRHESGAPGRTAAVAGEQVEIRVRDRGLGVPQRDIPKLFNRFVRLERDIAGPVRGTGVGLYMCRVLVEAMGGRIWVESAGVPGEGSTFGFTLPLHAHEVQPEADGMQYALSGERTATV